MWLITYFIFFQLKSFKLWEYKSTRDVFYQIGPWNSNFDNSGPLKRNFDTDGREKVIWAESRREVNAAGGRGLRAQKK